MILRAAQIEVAANQPERASVRFERRMTSEPDASAFRLIEPHSWPREEYGANYPC
jgi:hypothetical protein